LDRERRALELRTLTLQEDLKRAEVKRRDVRNTKEEFAANKEFEAFQKKVAEIAKTLEDRQKATQEKQQARDEKQKLVESLEADLKAADGKRAERIQEIHQQIKALEGKRHDFIGQVDEEVFSIYERVQKIRSGNGIAHVKGLMCSGCFVSIPPQLALMLDKMDSVITCPSCSRILYPSNDANSSTAA
jgi:predicted  nucleic acid-binding Zn-ribbon protein